MTRSAIHELLQAAAERDGGRPAVVDGQRSLTYGDLDRDSNRLARLLIDRGVAQGDRVGLFVEKSLEAVTAIYGTLKAGATYVPLDEQAPPRRLAYIIRDAGINGLVASAATARHVPELLDQGAHLDWVLLAGTADGELPGWSETRAVRWSELSAYPDSSPGLEPDPDRLAYILYTSGSTGEPKGVMLSHENGLAFVEWAAREVELRSEDRLSSHAPFHFDLSTFDLFSAASAGAAVVLVPREASIFAAEVARIIRETGITVWYSVPSILTSLVLRGGLEERPLDTLRAVVFAGEVFPTKYLARLMELVPQARYFNFYGPTETNVCTWYEVPKDRALGDTLPIGRPIPGVTAIVQREDGTLVEPGGVGELAIRGPTVMHGYWGDPERTSRVLSSEGGVRTYRTGDLVREDGSGELVFLGRRDAQVKTRGYRVELGEIEVALNALGAVVEAAVVAVPDETITNRLKAFVVTSDPVPARELARLCRDRLPSYMIPDEFEFRDELPKSSTGKVDRRALNEQ